MAKRVERRPRTAALCTIIGVYLPRATGQEIFPVEAFSSSRRRFYDEAFPIKLT